MSNDKELMIINETALKDKIYTIRGQKVMLDFDLAEIYGYTTKAFNQQVRNNTDRFPEDFRFQLTKKEMNEVLRSKNLTSSWGGSRYLPYAFTEQGIYMLMTVLKGDLAIQQSIAIIRLFKAMKDYLTGNQLFITQSNYYSLVEKVENNAEDIKTIHETMVTKADLSDIMRLFEQNLTDEEILILDGEPFKADEAYQKIYRKAKSKITIIDDYISSKTLHHLAHSKKGVKITVISDNSARPKLSLTEYTDFVTENPGRNIIFLQSLHQVHDRYIVLDEGTKDMKVYHCGASSKDAGNRITTITRISDIDDYKPMIKKLAGNLALILS